MTSPDPDIVLAAFHAYAARFGELPPLAAWYGPDAALVELIDAAIRAGRRLDESGLARAMGREPAPPGSLL